MTKLLMRQSFMKNNAIFAAGLLENKWPMPSMQKQLKGVRVNSQPVTVIEAPNRLKNWNKNNQQLILDTIDESPFVPFLGGFSDGANAVARVYARLYNIPPLILISPGPESYQFNWKTRKFTPVFESPEQRPYTNFNAVLILNTKGEHKDIFGYCDFYRDYFYKQYAEVTIHTSEPPRRALLPHLLGIEHHFEFMQQWLKGQGINFTY